MKCNFDINDNHLKPDFQLGGRVIDILLKETDTQWMFTLTGTCAEIEDDENVMTKKGGADKTEDKENTTATETSKEIKTGEDGETTSDEPPPAVERKPLSKDASTETDADGGEEEKDRDATAKEEGIDAAGNS